jgi:hypothetical protein
MREQVKPSRWTADLSVDHLRRYYRRLVAYYIEEAQCWMREARHWWVAWHQVFDANICVLKRVIRCCSSIRRLRAERDAASARLRRLEDELRNIEHANYRTWEEGLNTAAEFVLWSQSRARKALEENS